MSVVLVWLKKRSSFLTSSAPASGDKLQEVKLGPQLKVQDNLKDRRYRPEEAVCGGKWTADTALLNWSEIS